MNLPRGGQALDTAAHGGRQGTVQTKTALDSATRFPFGLRWHIGAGGLFVLLPDLFDRLTERMPVAPRQVAGYLAVGTIAALLNLAVLHLVYDVAPLPISPQARYLIGQAIATELATIVCFIGNDTFTFKHLAGRARHWWVRCLRFHSTTLVGILATFAVSATLHYGFGLHAVLAQALAIVAVLCMNFTLHHIWTYRQPGGGR